MITCDGREGGHDGAPSLAVGKALDEARVCHQRIEAGGSQMFLLGTFPKSSSEQPVLALPLTAAKIWRNITAFLGWQEPRRAEREGPSRTGCKTEAAVCPVRTSAEAGPDLAESLQDRRR